MRLRGFLSLAEPMKQDRSEAGKREIKSARTVLIKAMISSFYQYRSGLRWRRKSPTIGRRRILQIVHEVEFYEAEWMLH